MSATRLIAFTSNCSDVRAQMACRNGNLELSEHQGVSCRLDGIGERSIDVGDLSRLGRLRLFKFCMDCWLCFSFKAVPCWVLHPVCWPACNGILHRRSQGSIVDLLKFAPQLVPRCFFKAAVFWWRFPFTVSVCVCMCVNFWLVHALAPSVSVWSFSYFIRWCMTIRSRSSSILSLIGLELWPIGGALCKIQNWLYDAYYLS